MFRPGKFITRWLLTLSVLSVVLAWPLHEAQHAGESVGAHARVATELVSALATDPLDDSGEPEAASCPWCLFHADHLSLHGKPPALRFCAEATAPPAQLPGGLPTGRCTLAAAPRGPPRA
jgi:hypothetical protein